MLEEMIAAWRSVGTETPPFYFPGDEPILRSAASVAYAGFDDYIGDSRWSFYDSSLHLGLLPQPYMGDLRKATIFVLQLNPGLGFGDYFGEERVASVRFQLISNLRQEVHHDLSFPYLRPE